jgi:hypothetical protein
MCDDDTKVNGTPMKELIFIMMLASMYFQHVCTNDYNYFQTG